MMIHLALLLGLMMQAPADFAPGTLARDALPKSRALNYQFDDVRIATILGWLRRVGVEPPVPIEGRVSGWLWAQAPASGWWRVADYRVEGEITSPLLDVDRFSIRTARVRFGYRQNLWTFANVSGQIESQAEDNQRVVLGQANLNAQLPMSTTGTAQASGQINSVPLANLLATFGIAENVPSGIAEGNFRLSTPLSALSNPLLWQASGSIAAADVSFGKIAGTQLSGDWRLAERVLSLSPANITLGQQQLQAAGSLRLENDFAWSVDIPNQPVGLNTNFFTRLAIDSEIVNNLPQGRVAIAGRANGSLAPWQATYGLQLSNGQVNWFGNDIANLNTRVRLVADGLMLDSLSANIAGGSLNAQASFSTQANEPVTLNIDYQQIDLSKVNVPVADRASVQRSTDEAASKNLNAGASSYEEVRGIVSGTARVTVPKDRLSDLKAVALELSGTGAGVRVNDWGFGNIEYGVQKASGGNEFGLQLKDAGIAKRWQATGTLQPNDQCWVYHLDAQGNELDLSVPQLVKLIGVEPNLPVTLEVLLVTGNIKFEGDTQAGLKATQFNLSNITTLQQDRTVWAQGRVKGYVDPDVIQVDEANFNVGDSTIDGSATWHRQVDRTDDRKSASGSLNSGFGGIKRTSDFGEIELQHASDFGEIGLRGADFGEIGLQHDQLKLSIEQLSVETLQGWNLLPKNLGARRKPSGLIQVRIDVQRPVVAGQAPLANWRGDLAARVENLKVGVQELGNLALNGQLTPEQWQAKAEGKLLDAPIAGDVKVGFTNEPQWSIQATRGNLNWLGARIGRLTSLWQSDEKSMQWTGLANVRGEFDWQTTGERSGSAQVEIPQLAYRGRSIIRDLQAQLVLDDQYLRLARLDGGVGGGRAELSGAYNLQSQRAEGLAMNLSRIDLREVVQLIDPDMSVDIKGRADLRGKVWLNRGFDLHGDLRLHDALFSGIPISQAHSDLEIISSDDWKITRIYAHNVRGRAFGGRLDGDIQARLSTSRSLTVKARIQRGEVEQLSKWTGTASVVGRGKFDASLEVGSPRYNSTRDLQGRLDVEFEDTDARTLPVSDRLARFVPLFGLGSTEFERGRLAATISQGALRMRSLALWGKQLSVLGSGNVGLSNGRLDVQLVVRVGGGLSQQLAANYLTQLAATSVPPVELLLQINRLVANRAIFLRIAGTTSQPIIQPQTARFIEQALLRSLLEQAVGLPGLVSAVQPTSVSP